MITEAEAEMRAAVVIEMKVLACVIVLIWEQPEIAQEIKNTLLKQAQQNTFEVDTMALETYLKRTKGRFMEHLHG